LDELFERRHTFPDPYAQQRLKRLVGLDDKITRLTKALSLLVNPAGLDNWERKHHAGSKVLLDLLRARPPLVILAGDVGSGKTELAETVGDAVARQEDIDITLLPMSLSSRGQGRVGEMTQLVAAAFDYTIAEAEKLRGSSRARGAVILLIDEADALAQSRESAQMHHEDRAGVNALIRGVSRIANARLPAAVIMCTNRLTALDPAVKRRAADILLFERPNDEQRRFLLSHALGDAGFGRADIEALVQLTGPLKGRDYGFTFSDITQRLLPAIVLDAYPTSPLSGARARSVAQTVLATPPFQEKAV
jgi:SpoVK/Ycf46/Vps4 family AAA+-type ATPase